MDARLFLSAGAGMALAGSALGGVSAGTMFVTSGSTLFRIDGGSVETFDIGVELNSLSFDGQGRLWGTESADDDGNGRRGLYEITDPFGVGLGSLSHGDFLPGRAGSLSFFENQLMAFDTTNGKLLGINAPGRTTTELGVLGDPSTRPQSSAYDDVNDVLYGVRGSKLYSISLTPGYSQTEIATITGTTGGNGPMGGEWFDGSYYHSINDGKMLKIYTLNVTSGVLSEAFSFEVDGKGGSGFAMGTPVPAPAGAGALALAGLLTTRRRR
ncbi:MAG: hypothetical protein DHS20C14_15490 [Phycisphaeraceae bacterium]|nr:MAG: hypothetical protein DHS20C14_15490 [Phycisphaeraceae bacterium]